MSRLRLTLRYTVTHAPSSGSPESLTPEAIAVAALDVLDKEGADALSFRRVGAVLGTSHTTIHRHCGSLEGLLDLCADHLAAGLPDIEPTLSWAESTELRFTALYELWSAHWALLMLRRGRPGSARTCSAASNRPCSPIWRSA